MILNTESHSDEETKQYFNSMNDNNDIEILNWYLELVLSD